MFIVNIHTENSVRCIEFPETWNELSDIQIVHIAATLFEDLPELELNMKLVRIMMQYRYRELLNTQAEAMLEQVFPLVEWVKKDCNLTEQKIPVLYKWYGIKKYYGPSSGLLNLRFCEWDAAERCLYAFHQARSVESLYQFIAVLYRPKRKVRYLPTDDVSDLREAYNFSKTEGIAKDLQSFVSLQKAYAILLWYKGCRSHIQDLYPSIFNGSEAATEDQQPFFFPLMRSIAKSGIYGDIDKVEQLYLYTTLEEMVAAEEERAEVERAMKTNKTANE